MKILVLGATGGVGQEIVRQGLEHGHGSRHSFAPAAGWRCLTAESQLLKASC
jgi:uncharacterized protein YbjT (DUF2867 family)